MTTDLVYSVQQVAKKTGLAVRTVSNHCRAGKFPCQLVLIPGTAKGHYLLGNQAIKWLLENAATRPQSRVSKTKCPVNGD